MASQAAGKTRCFERAPLQSCRNYSKMTEGFSPRGMIFTVNRTQGASMLPLAQGARS
jgi:hypothetical protein